MGKAELSLHEAWRALDKDSRVILSHLSSINDPDERVLAAEKIFEKAKILARKLQAKYHPDINRTSGSQARFVLIGKAISSLEFYTAEMRQKREEFKNSVPKKDRIIING